MNTLNHQSSLAAHSKNTQACKVAVIGGGVIGVTTAYALIQAGCEVHVYEKGSTVALNSSFATTGVAAVGSVSGLSLFDAKSKYFRQLFSAHSAQHWSPRLSFRQWGFLARMLLNSGLSKQDLQNEAMLRLAKYSMQCKRDLDVVLPFEHEQMQGRLQLFKHAKDFAKAQEKLSRLDTLGIRYKVLDVQGCYAIEPSLAQSAVFAGGIYHLDESSANMALYTKQLKQQTHLQGVHYHFETLVTELVPHGQSWLIKSTPAELPKGVKHTATQMDTHVFDAVVCATGSDGLQLLQNIGIRMPMYPVRGYSLTLPIKSLEDVPKGAVYDDQYQVNITRLGLRLRVAGQMSIGSDALQDDASRSAGKLVLNQSAIKTLSHVLQTWFPYAGKLSDASYWCGTYPTMPEGAPVIGPTHVPGVFLNMGHGANAWSFASGCAQIVADSVMKKSPDIDTLGLTFDRFVKH